MVLHPAASILELLTLIAFSLRVVRLSFSIRLWSMYESNPNNILSCKIMFFCHNKNWKSCWTNFLRKMFSFSSTDLFVLVLWLLLLKWRMCLTCNIRILTCFVFCKLFLGFFFLFFEQSFVFCYRFGCCKSVKRNFDIKKRKKKLNKLKKTRTLWKLFTFMGDRTSKF